MWIDRDGVTNVEAVPRPDLHFDEESLDRLNAAGEDELKRLLTLLDSIEDEAHEALAGMTWTESEEAFVMLPLPADWGVNFSPGLTLAENVRQLPDLVELRWRLEATMLVATVIWDIQDRRHGSRMTRWIKRLVRR